MARGRFTVAECDIAIDHHPKEVQKSFGVAPYTMRIMNSDNTAKVHPILKSDAEMMSKMITEFRQKMSGRMLSANQRYLNSIRPRGN